MSDRVERILTGVTVVATCAFSGTVLFAMGSAFVALGLWMLRLAGLVA